MNQSQINLCVSQGVWMAQYTGAHAEDIQALFDSTILPTAFTSKTPAGKVLESIKDLNPRCDARIRAFGVPQ